MPQVSEVNAVVATLFTLLSSADLDLCLASATAFVSETSLLRAQATGQLHTTHRIIGWFG